MKLPIDEIESDKEINWKIDYDLSEEEITQLEKWTELKCSHILFDSQNNNWSQGSSILNKRIIGKKQVIFLINDVFGEKFGYYLNTEIIENYKDDMITDKKSFHFNLQSNGRLKHPMKFEIKDLKESGYKLFTNSDEYLLIIGDIVLKKEEKKNYSNCWQTEESFNYHGIKSALCGKHQNHIGSIRLQPKRILVIQMN